MAEHLPFTVVHASQVITMADSPTAALNKRKILLSPLECIFIKKEKVDACVSAGNTGAVLSAATLI